MKKSLKVITYNIHSGTNLWMIPTLGKIIEFLKDTKPDIAVIQEINENNIIGPQVSRLEKSLNMNCYFGRNVKRGNGYYGIATFSSFPIKENNHIFLPSKMERRGFTDSVVNVEGIEIHIINTHLGLDRQMRKQQFSVIQNYIESIKCPFILMGDFNTTNPEFSDILIKDSAKLIGKENIPTFAPSNNRIDYIFISNDFKLIEYDVLKVKMSDHYPVVAKLELNV